MISINKLLRRKAHLSEEIEEGKGATEAL